LIALALSMSNWWWRVAFRKQSAGDEGWGENIGGQHTETYNPKCCYIALSFNNKQETALLSGLSPAMYPW